MGAKGVVYVMSCTQGLLKIGCTATKQFQTRMKFLESNGYQNFNGLQREFAVEVDDFQQKEHLIHRLFDKSQVKVNGKGIEMFAVDLTLVEDLMRSFGGKQIYPNTGKSTSKGKSAVTVTSKTSGKKAMRPNLTFALINIPIGSTLQYTDDPSITVVTADNQNHVIYQGTTYTMSGLVVKLKNGGKWRGSHYFTYQGQNLVAIRNQLGV